MPATATTPTTTPTAIPVVLVPPPPDLSAEALDVDEVSGAMVTTTVWPAAVLVDTVATAEVDELPFVDEEPEDELDPPSVPAVPVPVVYTDQNPSPPPVHVMSVSNSKTSFSPSLTIILSVTCTRAVTFRVVHLVTIRRNVASTPTFVTRR